MFTYSLLQLIDINAPKADRSRANKFLFGDGTHAMEVFPYGLYLEDDTNLEVPNIQYVDLIWNWNDQIFRIIGTMTMVFIAMPMLVLLIFLRYMRT